mgnify:CR=1 FL=1
MKTGKTLPQMNAENRRSTGDSLTYRIIGVFFEVYNELGPGFLESVYESALAIALEDSGLTFERQVRIPVWFRGRQIGDYRADIVVDGRVLLELKSVLQLVPAHEGQVLNYLRATRLEIALLLNFGPKPQFRRLAYSNARKPDPR